MIAPHCEFRQSRDKCGTLHNVADDYTRIPPEGRHRAPAFQRDRTGTVGATRQSVHACPRLV